MDNITFLLTPAVEAYVIALIYRNTRLTCVSVSALCPWVSPDTVGRLLGAGLSSLRTAIVSLRLWTDQSRRLSCARRHGLAAMGPRRVDRVWAMGSGGPGDAGGAADRDRREVEGAHRRERRALED